MTRYVRGLGVLAAAESGRLKAVVKFVATQADVIRIGQPVSIDTRYEVIPGRVINVGSVDSRKEIPVDISLEGNLSQFGRATDLQVEGTIEFERLNDVLYIQRPGFSLEGSVSSLFKLDEGGSSATRVPVKFGKGSPTLIEILEGLNVGDKVIVTDMSRYANVNRIKLN